MQSVQRRLSRMRGERQGDEEKFEQEVKIKQLSDELDQKLATSSVLNEQIKRVNVRTTTISHFMQLDSSEIRVSTLESFVLSDVVLEKFSN